MWGIGISAGFGGDDGPSKAEQKQRQAQVDSWFEPSPTPTPGSSPEKSQGYLSWAFDTLTSSHADSKHLSSPEAFAEHMRKEALKKPKL